MTLSILRRGGSPLPVRFSDRAAQATPRVEPWNDMAAMDRLFSSAFDSFLRSPWPEGRRLSPAEPQFELYETGDELIACLYAPGLTADGFDISACADALTIKGERKPLLEGAESLVSHTPWGGLATGGGSFSASYSLPVEIDPNQVQAVYKDGVLQLRMAKSEAAKPRQVKVALGEP